MHRPLSLAFVAAVAACLFAPSVAAFTITITGLDSSPPALAPGESHGHPFTVAMASTTQQNMICTSDTRLTVDLVPTKTDPAGGFSANVTPASLQFTIPAGAYVGGANRMWQASGQSATLEVQIGENVGAGHTEHTYAVKASRAAGVPAGCQGDFPPAETEVDFVVPLQAGTGGTPGTGATNSTTPPAEGDSEDGSAPGVALVLAAVAVAAFARRRRA